MRVHPIKAYSDNYIWLIQPTAEKQVIVVDPGDSGPVKAWLKEHDASVDSYLITHHHWDHTDGLQPLLDDFPAPVYGPKDSKISQISQPLQEFDKFNRLGLSFEVLETPGHTLDHISFYTPGHLFCGDTLFSGGCGRMFEGTPEQFVDSLSKLRQLPGDTRVFCAHEYTQANLTFASLVEPDNAVLKSYLEKVKLMRQQDQITLPSSLQLELAINPFLRFDQPPVTDAAENHAKRELSNKIEVFAVIRQWKDDA
ncbi:hydroxyacylglutathione hydrolase [Idiomarina seosinensis]|uniref:Hydroxyacylglutathione hydrolase n=1 Tax=Idiomarina seosinensis TaxID=281739 RepID=A0A432ZIX9_9GAMM|nr:hydroxyacylglutathione hydrolase [Idiomarina seosinensis]RUO77921.1 hydroxyacylglutathione hydrolase [Idiomarina seosinensis]